MDPLIVLTGATWLTMLAGLWFAFKQCGAAQTQSAAAMRQAEEAARQAALANTTLEHQRLSVLYSTFNVASQAALMHPELLYDVHGLDRDTPIGEARSLAYLNLLLDAWQQYWGDAFKGDFARATSELRPGATYLHKVLSVPANRNRWERLKPMFYGQEESAFITTIDAIVDRESPHALSHSASEKSAQ